MHTNCVSVSNIVAITHSGIGGEAFLFFGGWRDGGEILYLGS